ncbi:MAG: DNA polymerase/3'-5' exonuclease PolX [Patescibacteria group bacterium]
MKNKKLADILNRIADYLEMDDVDYKPFAYQRAANSILELEKPINEIYEEEGREGIEQISGIGEAIADKVEEYLLTGEVEHLERLKEKFPIDMDNLLRVEGLGPKSIKKLYEELDIKNLKELKEKAENNEIANLKGFGDKTEKNILEAIDFLEKDEGKWSLGEVLPVANEIFEELKNLKEVKKISFAGSLRRKKELVGDVDILVSASRTKQIMNKFTSFSRVEKVLGQGDTKSSIKLQEGFDVDIRVVEKASFGSALQYFTGSKSHNIRVRKIAIAKGFKLNEYGLFKDGKKVAGKTEEGIYKKLGMTYIPPEIREDRGEVEEAQKGNKFSLCELSDIKGDLHTHTTWTGGKQSVEEMARAANELGYDYIGIADHTKYLQVENGLDEEELEKQRKEINKVNNKLKKEGLDFKILQGCEANILKDGSLDISDESLKKIDYVIAGIHSHFKLEKKEMTKRLIKAIKHPQVNIISHPTGRLIKKRESLNLDINKILKIAKEEAVILEINSSPHRLDLSDKYIKQCIENNQYLVINSDAHHKDQLKNMKYGINQARRGWAESKDIVNTKKITKLLEILNK